MQVQVHIWHNRNITVNECSIPFKFWSVSFISESRSSDGIKSCSTIKGLQKWVKEIRKKSSQHCAHQRIMIWCSTTHGTDLVWSCFTFCCLVKCMWVFLYCKWLGVVCDQSFVLCVLFFVCRGLSGTCWGTTDVN